MDYKLPKKRLIWWQKILLILFIVYGVLLVFWNMTLPTTIDINTFNWINTIGITFGVGSYIVSWIKDGLLNNNLKKSLLNELKFNLKSIKHNLSAIKFVEKHRDQDLDFRQMTNNTFGALVNTNKLTIFPEKAVITLTSFYNGDQTLRGMLTATNQVSLALLSSQDKPFYTDTTLFLMMKKDHAIEILNLMQDDLKVFLNIIEKDELFGE